MKVLKIIGIIVLVIIILGAGAVIFGPSEVHMERSVSINAPVDAVFAEVQGFKSFDQFSAWSEIDTTAGVAIGGPPTGVGARYSWDSDNPDLGKGTIEIIEMEPNTLVRSKMRFEGFPGEPTASWMLSEADGMTNVTYTYDQDNISGIWKLFAFGTESMLAPMYDRTLEKLKSRVEGRPELNSTIAVVAVDPITFAGIEATSANDPEEISTAMGEAYGAIMGVITANNLEMGGYPLAIATSYSETELSMICGIPVADGSSIEDEAVSIMQSPDGYAIKALHFGDYTQLEVTHEQINQYAIHYGYRIAGNPWEIYVTDPSVEADTSKWVTEVYYPTK